MEQQLIVMSYPIASLLIQLKSRWRYTGAQSGGKGVLPLNVAVYMNERIPIYICEMKPPGMTFTDVSEYA